MALFTTQEALGAAPPFQSAIKREYQRLFDTMTINPGRGPEIDAVAAKITAAKGRYQAIERATGVPWFFIGLLHHMESGNNFSRHLHNGDPLMGRTFNVPKGRPITNPNKGGVGPSPSNPYKFEESAIDALQLMQASSAAWRATGKDWSLPAMLYRLEAFNGFGYRYWARPINSPYLWSYSNHYTKGKYVADGVPDPNAVSKQAGTAVILYRVLQRDGSLAQYRSGGGALAALTAMVGWLFS